jgi:hypothetical protein
MTPIFWTLFATEALGASLGATEASTDGATVGAVVGVGLAVPPLVQAAMMSVIAPRLAAQAGSREWISRLCTCAPPLPLAVLGSGPAKQGPGSRLMRS